MLSHLWVCGYVGFGERFESREDERARMRASGKRTFILGGRGRHLRRRGDGSEVWSSRRGDFAAVNVRS